MCDNELQILGLKIGSLETEVETLRKEIEKLKDIIDKLVKKN